MTININDLLQADPQPPDDKLYPAPFSALKRLVYLERCVRLQARDIGAEFGWSGHVGEPPKAYLLCNDTFYYASGDAETVEYEDLDRLEEILVEAEARECYNGDRIWISEKRKLRPLKPLMLPEKISTWERDMYYRFPERDV